MIWRGSSSDVSSSGTSAWGSGTFHGETVGDNVCMTGTITGTDHAGGSGDETGVGSGTGATSGSGAADGLEDNAADSRAPTSEKLGEGGVCDGGCDAATWRSTASNRRARSVTKASKVAHNCSSSCVSDGGVTNGRARTARSRRAIHQRAPVKTKTKNCTSTTSIAKLYLSPIAHRTACSIFPEDTCRPTNSVIKRGAERVRRTSGLSQRCRERPPSATTIRLTARSGTPG